MTIYEQEGRAVKAGKYAAILRGGGVTSSQVQHLFTPEIWEELAELNGLRVPSAETIQAIIGLMEAEERAEG